KAIVMRAGRRASKKSRDRRTMAPLAPIDAGRHRRIVSGFAAANRETTASLDARRIKPVGPQFKSAGRLLPSVERISDRQRSSGAAARWSPARRRVQDGTDASQATVDIERSRAHAASATVAIGSAAGQQRRSNGNSRDVVAGRQIVRSRTTAGT